jgi:hypothetical protein
MRRVILLLFFLLIIPPIVVDFLDIPFRPSIAKTPETAAAHVQKTCFAGPHRFVDVLLSLRFAAGMRENTKPTESEALRALKINRFSCADRSERRQGGRVDE